MHPKQSVNQHTVQRLVKRKREGNFKKDHCLFFKIKEIVIIHCEYLQAEFD